MMGEETSTGMKSLPPLFAGIIFGIGWWILIGANIVQSTGENGVPYTPHFWAYYYIPGIIATFGLIMTNIVDVSSITGNSFLSFASPGVSARIRLWLFFSLSLMFGSIIAAVWIMAAVWMPPDESVEHSWPGVALMLQTLLIFVAAMILLWNRAKGGGEYDQF